MSTIHKAEQYIQSHSIITLPQLTAAATATESIDLRGQSPLVLFSNALFAITVAAITTNVVVRAQGSLDNVNWFSLDFDEEDATYTANGTYAIRYDGDGEIRYIRIYWVSESGGTAATLDVKAIIF